MTEPKLSLHHIIGQQTLLVDAPLIDQYEYGRLAVLSQWRVWLVLTKLRLEGKNWKYNHLRRLRGADVADRGHSVYLNDSVARTIAFLFGFMNESGFQYALLRRDSRPMVAHKTNSNEFFRTKISFYRNRDQVPAHEDKALLYETVPNNVPSIYPQALFMVRCDESRQTILKLLMKTDKDRLLKPSNYQKLTNALYKHNWLILAPNIVGYVPSEKDPYTPSSRPMYLLDDEIVMEKDGRRLLGIDAIFNA